MIDKEAVHPSDNLTDDDYSNIEDHETQNKRTNQNNRFYTRVDNELQSNSQLEDTNKTHDQKTTNNYESRLVIAYNALYPKILYVLYIRPKDNGIGHLIFKISTKQILNTMKYQPIPVPEDLLEAINKMDSFTTKIQIDRFHSNRFTGQDDHIDNTKDDSQI